MPAHEKDEYRFGSDLVDNKIAFECPCPYLQGWAALEKRSPNKRSFERNYGRFLVGRIEVSYNYYEDLYNRSPEIYSDDLKVKLKAWAEPDGYAGGTRQYWNAKIRDFNGQLEMKCVYLEYGTSMHGKPENDREKMASGWHQRKISCPVRDTEFRDGLYITYSLNVYPDYKKGNVIPDKAMRDIEKTIEDISRNIEIVIAQKTLN